jgi:hypothetical protein
MICPPAGPAASIAGINSSDMKTVAPIHTAASSTWTTRKVRNNTVLIDHLFFENVVLRVAVIAVAAVGVGLKTVSYKTVSTRPAPTRY